LIKERVKFLDSLYNDYTELKQLLQKFSNIFISNSTDVSNWEEKFVSNLEKILGKYLNEKINQYLEKYPDLKCYFS
jgi:hypothetical protein